MALLNPSAQALDSMLTIIEQARLMPPKYLDYCFNRFQTAAQGVTRPCVQEAFGRLHVTIAPKLSEYFFNASCQTSLEIELAQSSNETALALCPST